MAVGRLPGPVREFAGLLDGLLARLDQGEGWSGVFWQRDPEGMRACLEGREVLPWDVVEALLDDLAAVYGTAAADAERTRARGLYRAALASYDACPGARATLADRLDVMLRERRCAAERRTELTRLLTVGAPGASDADLDSLRLDLAWAHDDHARATARCEELRGRLAELDRRASVHPTVPVRERPAPGRNPSAGRPGRVEVPMADGGRAEAPVRGDRGSAEVSSGGGAGSAEVPVVDGGGAEAWVGDRAGRAEVPVRHGAGSAEVPGGAGAVQAPVGTAPFDPAPFTPAPFTPAPFTPAPFAPVSPAVVVPEADPVLSPSPGRHVPPSAAEPPPDSGAAPRKRRRGSARFAGMAEDEAAPVVVPQTPLPVARVPQAGESARPRGARFAGAPERPVEARTVSAEHVDAGADAAVAEAVGRLARLRAEGRSGEAHALLAEVAQWPPPRFPLLADALRRAGLGADWATLLWEAASLPAQRLVGVADALAAAGRDGDGRQLLRQGVARPAEQVGSAVLRLTDDGRQREARALLDACVRGRTAQEAARTVAPEPRRLVPLLLDAARGVSEERHWDLVHALRVAGYGA
ncbi:hypothetical protein BIV25_15210 [Streptomyces sp. MUSC 14]|uniref:hypothetical protein n=1 Tax=Streptomyces sp. MUSC 14 TaxID=1354889 RepID=UPI0008F589AC|nr:hypothetical protein [Streptomyces sp. MUSC 14]OIJ97573.1 hypothetical protein BIV25_15210 [Streptomyces sp. MUSC 14]